MDEVGFSQCSTAHGLHRHPAPALIRPCWQELKMQLLEMGFDHDKVGIACPHALRHPAEAPA
jgi:hypothetical protein